MPIKRNIHEDYDFFAEVEIKQSRLKGLFRTASRTVAVDELLNDETFQHEHETERYFALFWFHFTELQLNDEPMNHLIRASYDAASVRVDDILQPNDYPWELS